MFDHYEKEYLGTAKKATADIELIDQLLPGVEREATIKRAGEGITAAEEIVQGMEMEARSMTGEAKQQLAAKAKDYKKSIADMRAKLNAAKTSGKAEKSARDELLRSSDPTLRMEADSQRSRLMATNERLNNASDKIRGAVQTALETEKIGESILSDLADQRATIAHARGTLAGTMSGLDKSKKMLQGMGRRALKNKVLMYVVIATLIIMIMFIVYCACAARVPSVPCPFGLGEALGWAAPLEALGWGSLALAHHGPALAHYGAHKRTRPHLPSRMLLRQSNSSIHRRSRTRRPLRGRRRHRRHRRSCRRRGELNSTQPPSYLVPGEIDNTIPRSTDYMYSGSTLCHVRHRVHVCQYVSPGPAEYRVCWLKPVNVAVRVG